jgi:DNA-binding phage protein
MNPAAMKLKENKKDANKRRLSLKEQLGTPEFVLEQMADYMREGDVASITDLISSYISNSPKYKSQEQFAEAIGTTRQTLHRMLSHSDSVSLKVFFNAVERIWEDAKS